MKNSVEALLPATTQSCSGSQNLISEWLFRFGINFGKDIEPVLPLWVETFGGMRPEVLGPLLERAFKTCRFFPTVAEILAPLETVEQGASEDEWQALLDYCRQWVNRDVPMRGPKLPSDIARAAQAAGGIFYLESCSERDLIFAKQRFTEDLLRQRKTGGIAGFLPGSELRELLEAAAPRFALPETSENSPAPRAGHSESVPRPLLRKAERAATAAEMVRQGEALVSTKQIRRGLNAGIDTRRSLASD